MAAPVKPALHTSMHNDAPGHHALRITGCMLVLTGLIGGVGGVLFEILRDLARDWWWIATAICLLFVFRTHPMRRFSLAAGLLMLLIWLNAHLADLAWWIPESIHRGCLGFMLAILGVLLVMTNDPDGQFLSRFRRWTSIAGARRPAVLAVCVASLWIVNPAHSHSLCLGAADICERVGANRPAIVFTRLARDTFPPESFCGLCRGEMRQELSWRIARLRAQSSARVSMTNSANTETSAHAVLSVGRPPTE